MTDKSAGVLDAFTQLITPIVRVHLGVLLWRPPFGQMKDSVYTTLAHLMASGLLVAAILVLYSQQLPPEAASLSEMATALAFLVAPHAVLAVVQRFASLRNHYTAAILAGFAVADAATLIAMAIGVPWQETYWLAMGAKAFFSVSSHLAFRSAPAEVRRAGYGLRDGDV